MKWGEQNKRRGPNCSVPVFVQLACSPHAQIQLKAAQISISKWAIVCECVACFQWKCGPVKSMVRDPEVPQSHPVLLLGCSSPHSLCLMGHVRGPLWSWTEWADVGWKRRRTHVFGMKKQYFPVGSTNTERGAIGQNRNNWIVLEERPYCWTGPKKQKKKRAIKRRFNLQ